MYQTITKNNKMRFLKHISTGTDEGGNTYKHVRVQDFTSGNTKITNTYFFNGKKVTKYMRWTVQEWFANNFNYKSEELRG